MIEERDVVTLWANGHFIHSQPCAAITLMRRNAAPPDVILWGLRVFHCPSLATHLDHTEIRYREAFAYSLVPEPVTTVGATAPPVDRDARVLVDGRPVTPDHREINPTTGQQKDYVVLTAAERAKGFVRPVRKSYKHLPCGAVTTMALPLAETYARDPSFYSGTFCATCRTHFPLDQFVWLDDGSKLGS